MNLNQTPPPATPWNKARSPFIRYPSQSSPWSTVRPVAVAQRVAAKREFIDWLDKQNPALVAKAQEIARREVNRGLGVSPIIPRFSQDMNVRRRAMRQMGNRLYIEHGNGMGQLPVGFGQTTPPIVGPTIPEEQAEEGWLDKLIGAATTIAPAYLQFQQQKEILDMQLERAKQGLPPLETAYMAPTVRIQTELSPEAARTAREGIAAGLGNLALPILLVGGVMLLTMGRGRRRR